jgi:hypothetical protein
MKKIGIVIAAFAAMAMIFAGANSFACGDNCKGQAKTAAAMSKCDPSKCDPATCTPAQCAAMGANCSSACKNGAMQKASMQGGCSMSKASMSGGCSMSKASMSGSCGMKNAQMTEMNGTSCTGHKKDWASVVCGNKDYYGANVYAVKDGRMWAVCHGKTFEVTENSPYKQVGNARYYFADDASKIACDMKMAQMAPEIDQEAVALATTDGNVVGTENGLKVAQCVVTGKKFIVTADSPSKVADGKRYYVGDTVSLSTASNMHQ